jgi:hypothetical protein
MTTGTHDLSTLLEARNQSVADYGLDKIMPILRSELAVHNGIVRTLTSDLAVTTTDRQRKYGTSIAGDMYEVDEYGRAPTQLAKPGDTVGFPLKRFQYAIGWTQDWFERKTPADLAIAVQAGERAHLRMISREIKRALFLSANYTWDDFLVDGVDLSVKRLVNADSANIPEGPNGESFDGATHTHYIGEASLTAAFLTAWITDLVEHGHGNRVMVAISRTDEAAVRALTGFVAYTDARLTQATSTVNANQALDITRLDNRAIGIFAGAEVWVKSWMMANYVFIWDAGSEPPLVIRTNQNSNLSGLRVAATNSMFPLYAQYMQDDFGVAVWNRTNGVAAYFANATYADPTITS